MVHYLFEDITTRGNVSSENILNEEFVSFARPNVTIFPVSASEQKLTFHITFQRCA